MRRYYNSELSPEQVERLEWENWVVLMTTQAFLHSVSPHVLAIAIETSQPKADVTVHVALREHSKEGEIDVEEGVFAMEAMLDGRVRVGYEVSFGHIPEAWRRPPYRWVFATRR